MSAKLLKLGSLMLMCMGIAHAQDIPGADTGLNMETFTLPSLTDEAGRAPERIGGDPAGSALSSPVVGEIDQYPVSGTSAVNAASESGLLTSQGGPGGPQGKFSSAWATSGFATARAGIASSRQQQVSGSVYTALDYGTSSSTSSAVAGRALPFGQQIAARQSSLRPGTQLDDPLATDPLAALPEGQSSVPDLTGVPDTLGRSSDILQGLAASGGGGAQSSIQTPTFSYGQFGLAGPSSSHAVPRRTHRREPTLHDRLMLRSYGSRVLARNARARPAHRVRR